MAPASPEDRRERASRHNVSRLENKPSRIGDQLRELGLAVGLLLSLACLILLADGLFVTALGAAGLSLTTFGASLLLAGDESERRWLHLVNVEDETLRFALEIRDDRGRVVADHAYELPPGERAVLDDTSRPDTDYTIAVSPDRAAEVRTTVTPVRSAASSGEEALVVEVDRSGLRTGSGTGERPADPEEGTPHELWLAE